MDLETVVNNPSAKRGKGKKGRKRAKADNQPSLPFGEKTSVAVATKVVKVKKLVKAPPKKESDRLRVVIPRLSEKASELRALQLTISKLQDAKKVLEEKVISAAGEARLLAEKAGNFTKTVEIPLSGDPLLVIFADKFSAVDTVSETVLRKEMGLAFETCFRKQAVVKAKDTLTMDILRETLGDKLDAYLGLFDVTEVITAQDGLMEKRAALRPQLSKEANDRIDLVVAELQHKPSVK